MTVIVGSSYKKYYLNNFFILLNKELSLFNNALSRFLYYSLSLQKLKIFFFYLIIVKKYVNLCSFRIFFIFLMYLLQRYNSLSDICFFFRRFSFFFYNFFSMFYSISSKFFNAFLLFIKFSVIYTYLTFFFIYYRNNGYSLPTKKHYEIVLRSPHGHKKAKERFVKKLYRRGIQCPLFYATDTNLLFSKLFNYKKGLLISYYISIDVD